MTEKALQAAFLGARSYDQAADRGSYSGCEWGMTRPSIDLIGPIEGESRAIPDERPSIYVSLG